MKYIVVQILYFTTQYNLNYDNYILLENLRQRVFTSFSKLLNTLTGNIKITDSSHVS